MITINEALIHALQVWGVESTDRFSMTREGPPGLQCVIGWMADHAAAAAMF